MQLSATVSSVTSSISNSFNAIKNNTCSLFTTKPVTISEREISDSLSKANQVLKNDLAFFNFDKTNIVKKEITKDKLPTHVEIDGVMTDISDPVKFPRHGVLQGDNLVKAVEDLVSKVKNS